MTTTFKLEELHNGFVSIDSLEKDYLCFSTEHNCKKIRVSVNVYDLKNVSLKYISLDRLMNKLLKKALTMKKLNLLSHWNKEGKMFNEWLIWACATREPFESYLNDHLYDKNSTVIHAICYKYINMFYPDSIDEKLQETKIYSNL